MVFTCVFLSTILSSLANVCLLKVCLKPNKQTVRSTFFLVNRLDEEVSSLANNAEITAEDIYPVGGADRTCLYACASSAVWEHGPNRAC